MAPKDRVGLLLVNLGTPESPDPRDVRPYLREFLSDPRVLDIGAVPRWLLLNLVILPFRPRRSGEAYEKIWTERAASAATTAPTRWRSTRCTTARSTCCGRSGRRRAKSRIHI